MMYDVKQYQYNMTHAIEIAIKSENTSNEANRMGMVGKK